MIFSLFCAVLGRLHLERSPLQLQLHNVRSNLLQLQITDYLFDTLDISI